ncbi:NUDIX hydrolase [Bifidobacterium imperatoris]|uniref:NTP pyrophosphohydrolase n=1 Tax=Bifidobacterium imperatoris TaxID=2020965 RepID=A0A2N5IUK6_9BIFI|nr:NUDIX hydrolase [Bifidobacterium imperatoris]PLS25631.1 NTP pyrophosphohydrolase [Bifidobacterium imperatoris]QSY57188.1 NUDIX hydrolase [Bifidobacterium imperatoris]
MFGHSKQEQLEHRLDRKLNASSDGIDMDVPAEVLNTATVYTGRIFHVDDMTLALTDKQGNKHEISRQVLRHAPCVVMLVHDMSTDRYLIEREYRAGSDMFAYGLPAGLMDEGEDILDAALRELAEETGVVPDRNAMGVDYVGDFYSSEGMTDELAHIMVLHLGPFKHEERHFDPDEHVESAWIPWSDLAATRITASNSMIAIQHEALRRLIAKHADDENKPSLFS